MKALREIRERSQISNQKLEYLQELFLRVPSYNYGRICSRAPILLFEALANARPS